MSPENARSRLTGFLRNATSSLEIYDSHLTEDHMIGILQARADKGVSIRILGELEKKWRGHGFNVRAYPGKRLHVRAIVRDGQQAFVGSQSLRKLELDKRREVGLIIRDAVTVKRIQRVFEEDWGATTSDAPVPQGE